MKIITVIADGHGRVYLAATRAPDLLRRQISGETGHATLVAVALAPAGFSPESLIARIDRGLTACRIAPGIYAVDPAVVVRASARARRVVLLRALLVSCKAGMRRRFRATLELSRLGIRVKPQAA